jgi:hypothetical protein
MGPLQPNFDEAAYLSLVGPEAQHNVEDVKLLKRQYQMMSSIGLASLALASALSLWRSGALQDDPHCHHSGLLCGDRRHAGALDGRC